LGRLYWVLPLEMLVVRAQLLLKPLVGKLALLLLLLLLLQPLVVRAHLLLKPLIVRLEVLLPRPAGLQQHPSLPVHPS
jgi:hypothetical protein